MLSPSSLSVAARTLRTHLTSAIGLPEGQILIGHPSDAKDRPESKGKQYLNLFFYRVEHGAYPADGTSEDPFYLRFYCLITALGSMEAVTGGGTISAGENDLRLVGGVMQGLHENPVLMLQDDTDENVAQMQVVLHALSLDDLNHIWSTQGDTPYRLSVGYELALLPLPLMHPQARGPRIGSIGVQAQGSTGYTVLAGWDAGTRAPQVPVVRVEGARPDWTPHICWLDADSNLQYSLAFAADALPAVLKVIPLGAPGADVRLSWEVWNPNAPDPNWQAAVAAPANLTVATDRLSPAQSEPSLSSLAQNLAFPLSARGQAMLYASRDHTRPDGTVIALRSNPLLVSVYEATP